MSENKYEFKITDPLILEAFKRWDESDDNPTGVPENLAAYESTFDAGFRAGWEMANTNAAYNSERRWVGCEHSCRFVVEANCPLHDPWPEQTAPKVLTTRP